MRRGPARLLLLILPWAISLAACAPQPAPPAAGAGPAGASGAFRLLHDAVVVRASQVAPEFSRTGFELRQQLDLLAQTLRYLATALDEPTYAALEPEQRDAVAGVGASIGAAVASWEDRSRLTVAAVTATLARAYELFDVIPAARREPRVLTVSPAYGSSRLNAPSPSVTVTITGARLGAGDPVLRFERQRCGLRTHRATELVFDCPPDVFYAKSLMTKTGVLAVFRGRTFMQAFLQRPPVVHGYALPMPVLPPALGTYKATATTTVNRIEEARRQTADFLAENDFCEGSREVVWTVESTPGWTIDTRSVLAREFVRTGASRGRGAFERTDKGFKLGGVVNNSGTCADAPDGTKTQDTKGSLGVRATYREYRTVAVPAPIEVGVGAIPWGGEVSVPLPLAWTGVTLEVAQIDGRHVTADTVPSAQPWFTLALDETRRRLLVRGRDLASVLE